MNTVETLLNAFALLVLLYFLMVTGGYLILLLVSTRAVRTYMRRTRSIDYLAILRSEFATPVSILAPAFNESATIVQSVHSLLSLEYPSLEVIVINDGSTDATLRVLTEEFSLRLSSLASFPQIPTKEIRGIYVSTKRQWDTLIVVDKVNGGKADALNAGINVARHPLFCAIDADSILESDALLKVARPFMDNPHVVAAGGIIRIANDCLVERGRVTDVRLPHKRLPLFQIIEYLRAFLAARMAWSTLNALLIISGAFGMFRRDIVIACGGYKTDTVGEDMELVTRMHRVLLERGAPYRMVFIPDPVCWTEAPETLRSLGRQRNRWHRGLLDTVLRHRRMLFNPRYKAVGLLALPFFTLVELLGPIIEALGYLVIPVATALGMLDISTFVLFTTMAVVYGIFVSIAAVLLEEISFRRYGRPADLLRLLLHAFFENLGYRQMTVWWRVKACWDYFRGEKSWGAMPRRGFARAKP
jgi:cellulose synthase/poly-beta-1,6-N-acetylglucosamine synthase-like glycosyltransferase